MTWLDPPEREEAGSPNVIGAVALRAAIGALRAIGWPAVADHDRRIGCLLRRGLAKIPGVRLLGPGTDTETLPVATFTVDGVPDALVAARLAAEEAIGVRHGNFYAYPYLTRLLGLSPKAARSSGTRARDNGNGAMVGAIRASAGINTSEQDVTRLLAAIARLIASKPQVRYRRDPLTSEFSPARPAARATARSARSRGPGTDGGRFPVRDFLP